MRRILFSFERLVSLLSFVIVCQSLDARHEVVGAWSLYQYSSIDIGKVYSSTDALIGKYFPNLSSLKKVKCILLANLHAFSRFFNTKAHLLVVANFEAPCLISALALPSNSPSTYWKSVLFRMFAIPRLIIPFISPLKFLLL
jgi:hypothetical protein